MWQLSFRNSISVENDARRLEPGGFVELNQQLSHHVRQILNDLLPGSLDSHCGTISAGMSVHTAYHLENSGLKGRVTIIYYKNVPKILHIAEHKLAMEQVIDTRRADVVRELIAVNTFSGHCCQVPCFTLVKLVRMCYYITKPSI